MPPVLSQPQTTQPAMISPGDHWAAYSPNVDEGLDFGQAYGRLQSSNQQAAKSISQDIMKAAGIKDYEVHDAIGDWSDGAENSLFHVIKSPVDPKTAEYVAAWNGLLQNQKAVLHFTAEPEGPDSLYQIFLPETSSDAVRESLDHFGLKYRTIVPRKTGTTILLFDEKHGLRPNVQAFAEQYDATIREAPGRGQFIGDPAGSSRTKARADYRRIIKSFEEGKVRANSEHSHDVLPSVGSTPTGVRHAPEGGAVVRGMNYSGGEVLPNLPQPSPLRKSAHVRPVRYSGNSPSGRTRPSGRGREYRPISGRR